MYSQLTVIYSRQLVAIQSITLLQVYVQHLFQCIQVLLPYVCHTRVMNDVECVILFIAVKLR